MKKFIAILAAAAFVFTGSVNLAAAAPPRGGPPPGGRGGWEHRDRRNDSGRWGHDRRSDWGRWNHDRRGDWGRWHHSRPAPRYHHRSSSSWQSLMWGIPIAVILASAVSSSANEPARTQEPVAPPPLLSSSTAGSTETIIEMMEQDLQRELAKNPVDKAKVAGLYAKIRSERNKLDDARFYEYLNSLK